MLPQEELVVAWCCGIVVGVVIVGIVAAVKIRLLVNVVNLQREQQRDVIACADGSKAIRPPLGLRPRYIWLQERIEEIEEARNRYLKAGRLPPVTWTTERDRLHEEIEARYHD